MTSPRLHHVQCLGARGLHRMAYWEWGDAANPRVLVCVHGLARQGRDFDVLAEALSDSYRVVCPDVVGRGESDALVDPGGYQIENYVADMVTLLARLDAPTVHWLGTSMGGLIGIGLASLPQNPITRLVLNDVGPSIDHAVIERLGSHLGLPLRWDSLDDAADYLQTISKGFGPHTRAQWLALTLPMLKPDDSPSPREHAGRSSEGTAGQHGAARIEDVDSSPARGFRLHYDPRIALPFNAITPEDVRLGEALMWAAYDAIRCPTLVLRGAESDLLTPETASAMTVRGPQARVHEFAGVGHAPTLVVADQVAVVQQFLLS